MTAHADAERDLDREFRAIAHALVHDTGARRASAETEMPNRRPIPLVAAALIVAAGIGAVIALTGVGAVPQNGSAPAPTVVLSTLVSTTNETPFATLLPFPTSNLLEGLDVTGEISYVAGEPAPMTRAVIGKLDGDGWSIC